jgi:uncharacterized protein (TIGR01777 family)
MNARMRVVITGATGFIGKALLQRFQNAAWEITAVARKQPADLPAGARFFPWDALSDEFPAPALDRAAAVIHLAGEPVAQRWNAGVKQRIRDSRVTGTRRLVEALSTQSVRPEVLVSASATGYYGDRADEPLPESAKPGKGFLADVSVEWEKTATLAEALGMRVVLARTGIVLSPQGGALAQMLPPFRLGAGGPLGSGKQWMSWIHLHDEVELLFWAATNTAVRGPLNLTAPNPVTNADFGHELGHAVHRPAVLPVPGIALKLMFGEMAEVLLGSQRVLPQKALSLGFSFRYPELAPALADLLA